MRALFLLIPAVSGITPLTAATAARSPSGNIANFIVKTDNLDEARRFYVGVLGYDEVTRNRKLPGAGSMVFAPPAAEDHPLKIAQFRAWRVKEPVSNRRYTVVRGGAVESTPAGLCPRLA